MQTSGAYFRPYNYSLKVKASFQINDHVDDNNDDDNIYVIILMEIIMYGRYGN